MTFRPIILASLLALAGCSDKAGSDLDASKTAAYIVLGLEEGTSFPSFGDNLPVFKQTSASPLTYVADNEKLKMTVSITKQDDCNYGFELVASDGTYKFSFDFSGLTSAAVVDNPAGMGSSPHATSLAGAKMACEGPQSQGMCQIFKTADVWPLRFIDKDPARLPEVVQTFKSKYCKGKAG
ncbi:hypothetical protein [Rhizobium leguminosarum]|uniref:hypothetical protein n=1 Tax=Rhizobium leguminosarum TaxID=384 RepID=UPI001C900431|nr:hypothetical protein [Rhizobium leguminosarum]MBY2985675.1 hypothetical protein [Rhizobium leguminosarum]